MSGYTAEQLAVARQLSAEFSSRSGKSRGRASGRSGGGISASSYPTRASILRPKASLSASGGSQASGSGRFALRGTGASRVAAPATDGRESGRPIRDTQPVSSPTVRTSASPFTNRNYSPANVAGGQSYTPKVSGSAGLATETVGVSYICGNSGNRTGVSSPAQPHAKPPRVADTEVINDHDSAHFGYQITPTRQVRGSGIAPTEDNKNLDASYTAASDPPSKAMSVPDHFQSPDSPTSGNSNPGIIEVEVAEGQKAKIDTSQPVIWNWMSGESPKVRPPTAFVEEQEPLYDNSADIFSKKPLGHRPLSPILEPMVYFDHNLPPPVVEYYQSTREQSSGQAYYSAQGTSTEKHKRSMSAGPQHENCTCNRDLTTIKGLGGSRFSQEDTRPVQNQNRFTGACPVHYEQKVDQLGATLSSFTL